MHVDRSASIKSANSDSEKTVYSDASGSTLEGSSYAKLKKDEEKSVGTIPCAILDNEWSSRPSWVNKAATSIRTNVEGVKSQASCIGLSVKDTFIKSGKYVGNGSKACAKRFNAAILSARNACSAIMKSSFKGLWVLLCAWRSVYVEFFFAALFSISAALLAFTIAIKENAPVDPVDLQRTTQSRLSLIMGFSIFMLIMVPICVMIFEVSGRGSSGGCGLIFLVQLIVMSIWIFVGLAFAAGWSSSETEKKYPSGLQCTYNLSTPTAGLCHQVHTVRALLLTELILTFITFGAVVLAVVFPT